MNNNTLASLMNDSKWRRLAHAMMQQAPRLTARTKFLDEPAPEAEPFTAGIDWTLISHGHNRSIEWMEIDPVLREYRGRLIAPQETDHSALLHQLLQSCHIPYSQQGHYLKVWGYIDPAHMPDIIHGRNPTT